MYISFCEMNFVQATTTDASMAVSSSKSDWTLTRRRADRASAAKR